MVTKSQNRIDAENKMYNLLDTFDTTKYNSNQYKRLFDYMSNEDFKKYMESLVSETQYISMEIDTFSKELTLDKIFEKCEKLGVKTHKYVLYRENKSEDGKTCSITSYPALILYIPIKRLQQMVSKKNSASANTDRINILTGTVTGDSKSASLNDTQTLGLLSTKQFNTLKELHGPRSDDAKSKIKLLQLIEDDGEVSLADLNINPINKQSLQTFITFMKAINIEVEIK